MRIEVNTCDRCRAYGPDTRVQRRGIIRDDKTVWLHLCADCREPLDDLWSYAPTEPGEPRGGRRRGIEVTPIEDLPIPDYELRPPTSS